MEGIISLPPHPLFARGVVRRHMQTLNGRPCLLRRDVERITRRESQPIHPLVKAVEISEVPGDLLAQPLGLIGAEVR